MKINLYVILMLTLFSSCVSGGADSIPEMVVYKMKGDYSRNMWIGLDDKGKVISFIDTIDSLNYNDFPIKLINGYYTGGTSLGISYYTVPTNYTVENAHNIVVEDSLVFEIIDSVPFIEFYSSRDQTTYNEFHVVYTGVDTSRLNEVIRNGELENYFDNRMDNK